MQHSVPKADGSDFLRNLISKFEDFAGRQTGEVQASLLAFLHLVDDEYEVITETSISENGDLRLEIKAYVEIN